jgi:excisionase family DNA binding protein
MSERHENPSVRIDVREVARRLGCSTRAVYKLAAAGTIPYGRKLGNLRRWPSADIDAFIEGAARPAAGEGGGR